MEEQSWTFPLLCDGGDVIEKYSISNDASQKEGRQGIPHPATIIIDLDGIVRFKNVWIDFKKRTTPQLILQELDNLNEP